MNILVAAYTGLGNSILITPLIQALKKKYPKSTINIVGDDRFLALSILQGLPINIVKANNYNELSNVLSKIDVAFLPRFGNTPWLELGLRSKGVPVVKHLDSFLLNSFHPLFSPLKVLKVLWTHFSNSKILSVPIIPQRHETELNLDLLRQYSLGPVESPDLQIGIVPHELCLSPIGLQAERYIVFQPSVANGTFSSKRWDPQNFVSLAEKIFDYDQSLKIILVGDKGDAESLKEIVWPQNVLNALGKTDLSSLVSFIKFAKIGVFHDSGVMHIAAALKTKGIALLGPTDHYRTGPLSKNILCLFSKNEHYLGMYYFKSSEAQTTEKSLGFEAMSGISVDDVFSTMKLELEKK